MTAKPIPYVGQTGNSDQRPFAVRMSKIRWGISTADNAADIAILTTDVYNLWSVPVGMVVIDMYSRMTTKSAAMVATIGDSDDEDGWFTDTVMAPQDSETVVNASIIGAGAYATTREYTTAQTIDMKVTTANTDGAGTLFLLYTLAGLDSELYTT